MSRIIQAGFEMEMGRHCRTPAYLILPDARADDAYMGAPFGKGSFYLSRHRRQESDLHCEEVERA